MSEKNNSPETEVNNEIQAEAVKTDSVGGEKVVGRKKRFNKSDIFVFGICLVLALLVWFYASNRTTLSDETPETDAPVTDAPITETQDTNVN